MNKEILEKLKVEIEKAARELLGDRLTKVILYGSYARGDFDEESDIDFALMSKLTESEIPAYNDPIGEITSKLSRKYGILITLIIISSDSFNRYKDVMPFYMNLVKEGDIFYG
ncbi:MAG: nucleotidyltransferase domain-containing protein [Ignavibacteriaceae bacterium]|jgi:predicted nucleotidyltransferase